MGRMTDERRAVVIAQGEAYQMDLYRQRDVARAARAAAIAAAAPIVAPPQPVGPVDRRPQWYITQARFTGRQNISSNADTLLLRLQDAIRKFRSVTPLPAETGAQASYKNLREIMQKASFAQVTASIVKTRRLLDPGDGISWLIDSNMPVDIKSDARELYNCWEKQIFEVDLLRGIVPGKPKNLKSPSDGSSHIDPNFQAVNARIHGNNGLVNGQWFPTQLTALRDGAHGVTQGGVCGTSEKGAFSCIMSSGLYPDEDHGDWVLYCGTDAGSDGAITEATQRLIQSVNGEAVRLLRGHNMPGPHAPKFGFRYDGLYKIVSYQCIDQQLQRHRFKLVREAGQDPIRSGDNDKARPYPSEIEVYKKDKKMRGFH